MTMMEMLAVGTLDSLSPYFLLVALFLGSICFLGLVFREKSSPIDGCPLPPGRRGWPIIGESLNFHAAIRKGCPEMFVTDRTSKYFPDVFRTSLFGENIAMFCGAPGNKFLFSGDNKYVKTWWPKSVSKVFLSPEAGEDSKQVKEKVQSYLPDFLKPEPLKYFVPIMDSMAKDHLTKVWFPNGQVRVFPSAKDYMFDVACRIFMNIEDAHDIEKLYTPFANIMPGLLSVSLNVPGTPFNKAIEGGKKIREQLINVTRNRKDEIAKGEDGNSRDLVTRLLKESNDNEWEIANMIIGLLVASHETTSTAITFVINYLAQLIQRIYSSYVVEPLLTWRRPFQKDSSIGFGAPVRTNMRAGGVTNAVVTSSLLESVESADLIAYGLIPEFIGRFPILVSLSALTEDQLVRVLSEPKNALGKQYKKLFSMNDVKLYFTDKALRLIAKKAMAKNTGARGLRALLESILTESMFEIPDVKTANDRVDAVVVDEESVGTLESPGCGGKILRGDGALERYLEEEKQKSLMAAAGENATSDEGELQEIYPESSSRAISS